MSEFSKEELQFALRSIASTLGKCEKALLKLKPGASQHTLLTRRIDSFRVAAVLITEALEKLGL